MRRFGVERIVYAIGALGGGVRGYELGVVAAALLFAAPDLHMSPAITGTVVSAALFGSLVAALAAGALADALGRQKVIALAAIVFSLGILGAALSPNVKVLILSRLVLGAAVGLATVIIPIYISEMAPARTRGASTGLFQVMIYGGVLASSIAGIALAPFSAWRWMFGIGLLPALIMFVGAYFLPESPRWLVRHGQEAKARMVLARFRGVESVDLELEGIRDIIAKERSQIGLGAILRFPKLRKWLIVGSGLGILQQLVGINAVTYYAPTVLKGIGFSVEESILANVGFSALGLVMTVVMAQFIADKVGRRIPLMLGAIGMSISMAALGIVLTKAHDQMRLGFIVVACLALFQICFALSWGGMIWIVLGEMFPLSVRGTAMGVAVFMAEATSVLVGFIFPVMLTHGSAWIFQSFAGMGLIAFLWVAFMLPETKHLSLEDIELQLLLGQ